MKAIVTVIGKDRVGIIASICQILSRHNVNVLDISQTILEGNFTMIMVVDTSACDIPFSDLVTTLENEGTVLDLTVHAQREDLFQAMHRI